MSLSSPCSLSGKNENLSEEKISSSVSSLLVDYCSLNSIIQSNLFEKALEIFSFMSTTSTSPRSTNDDDDNDDEPPFLSKFIKEFLQICSSSSAPFTEFISVVQTPHFSSLISSYDLILQHYHRHQTIPSADSSLNKDQYLDKDVRSSFISMLSSKKLLDDEKENCDYASKLAAYNVSRLKIVRLEKRPGEPLGATICRLSDDDYRICIARILFGSVAQGLFSIGDQLLEINNVSLQNEYRSLDEIVQLIDSLHGPISFVLLPANEDTNDEGKNNHAFEDQCSSMYVRALFSYDPYDDMYIPCRELGLAFEKDAVLQLVNRDDSCWWQAFLMEHEEKKKKEIFPGLIPSKSFQEKRLKIVKCLLDEGTLQTKKRLKKKASKSVSEQSTRQKILTTFSCGIYEPVEWYIPTSTRKRPIVLIGPPHIGRHELRQRLMNCPELCSLIDVAVPHTTRLQKSDEVDGRDYHFISRAQFERDITADLFVEHGEYEKNLYGTSKNAVEMCCQTLNKICILNLLPEGLDSLKCANLFPFIIYMKTPSSIDKLREYLPVSEQQWTEIEVKARTIEENYAHLFDQILLLNESFESIFAQLKSLVQLVQNKPMWINQCWFSPRERF